ncbi:ATP-binding protein [Sulfurimonas sp.]
MFLHFKKNLFIVLFILFYYNPFLLAKQEQNISFLNQKEQQWLQSLQQPLTVGITPIPNQVLLAKDGKYQGFSIDLFTLIEKKLHIHFKYVNFASWNQLMIAAKKNRIDIVFSVQKTPSRLQYLDFTDAVLKQQNNIIVNINNDKYDSIEKLSSKKVAVSKGSAIEEFLRHNYPDIQIVAVHNELAALRMLHARSIDAAISESVRASYYIKKYNLNNLRIANTLGYDYYLDIGSQRSQPFLNVILSKTITNIPKKQIESLQLKWGYIKDKVLFFDKQTLIYITLVFGIIIPFSLYLYIINKKLQSEIRQHKKTIKELQLMRQARLTQMSEIISMIAHQWKQPLNNLSLIHQVLLSKHKKGKMDAKALENFQQNSKKQINLMLSTIDDFKNFFQVKEQKMPFDVQDTIEHVLDVTKPALENHAIVINCHKKKNENFALVGYASALIQVLLNLVNNAKDALIENDTQEKRIDIKLITTQEYIIISIEDNAGGIPADILNNIFAPYFTTKAKNGGTGLGLYMSKTIVEEHMNGKLEVVNTTKGANFLVYLKR